MKKKPFRWVASILLPIFLISFSGCKSSGKEYNISLSLWGIVDDSDAFESLFADYRKINPFVQDIKYRKILVDEYKKDLLEALASGKGPDIFLIRNTWLPEFKDKIAPAPKELIGEKMFRDTFPDVAEGDLLDADNVLAVPMSIDSLALYYNKDLFNFEGITEPPRTWDEFNEDIKKMTKIGGQGEITQAGAAIGTAYNINRSTDILNALFAQSGVPTIERSGRELRFGQKGENAFTYFTQFANRSSSLYTWNPLMHYSLDAFYEGKAAMMINYSWHYDTIKRKNAKLNFAVAPLPQAATGIKANYSNYWAFAVNKNKISLDSSNPKLQYEIRIKEAWELLKFMAMNNGKTFTLTNFLSNTNKEVPIAEDPAEKYLKMTRKPAARIDLIDVQQKDPFLSPFAYGNLIAKTWPQPNSDEMDRIMAEAINSVNYGQSTIYEATKLMESRMGAFFR